MTQKERMLKGLVYDCFDDEIVSEQNLVLKKFSACNSIDNTDYESRYEIFKSCFAECGTNVVILSPVHANFGGKFLHIGNNFFSNFNLVLVDDGPIYVGDNVMFGPNVSLITAAHPVEIELRKRGFQFNKPIHIGNNVWLGANVTILPGVSIGENSVIGAGSVVTKDIPANVVAFGNPCHISREIGEKDKKYFFKNEEIDWENIK